MQQEYRRCTILHVIDELKMGGAQTHLVTLLREMTARSNVQHAVLSLFGDGEFRADIEALGIQVEVLDLQRDLSDRRFLNAIQQIEEIVRKHQPEVLEAHLTWSRLLALPAARRAGVRARIGFEHGDIYLTSWKFRAANFASQFYANTLIVCSEALAQWNRSTHGVFENRMTVLHNCVDVNRFRPHSNHQLRSELCSDRETTLFAAVGSLGRGVNKRMDVCIRAIAEARNSGANVGLAIIGEGEQRSDLEALAETLAVSKYVRFLGHRRDVQQVLGAFDGFCHSAPFEPFGIVCIEAMACGLPVIVPASGGIAEAVRDGQTGLQYCALDHNELASKLCILHSNKDMRRQMGTSARRDVVDRFSVQQYVNKLLKIYKKHVGMSACELCFDE